MSRKGGAGGGGWVHPKGANSMAVPKPHCRKSQQHQGTEMRVCLSILETENHLEKNFGPKEFSGQCKLVKIDEILNTVYECVCQ